MFSAFSSSASGALRRPALRPVLLTTARRGLANKVFDSAAAAIHDIKDGTSV